MDEEYKRHDDHQEFCQECGCSRSRHVDRKTGRYHVMLPTSCQHKTQCDAELMKHYDGRQGDEPWPN